MASMTHDAIAAPACVRCSRPEADHDLARDGQADDIKRRIWRALGQPCAVFAEQHAVIFAQNQAASSRRARPARNTAPAFNPRTAAAAGRGAALARQLLQGGTGHVKDS